MESHNFQIAFPFTFLSIYIQCMIFSLTLSVVIVSRFKVREGRFKKTETCDVTKPYRGDLRKYNPIMYVTIYRGSTKTESYDVCIPEHLEHFFVLPYNVKVCKMYDISKGRLIENIKESKSHLNLFAQYMDEYSI